jgi:EAL domain
VLQSPGCRSFRRLPVGSARERSYDWSGITADEIKVDRDRSFISAIHERPRSQSVLRAIESLGQALGMTIVAEGVETFEALAYLEAATRIRYAQGYYFSKPFFLEEAASAKRVNFSKPAFAEHAHSGRSNGGRAVEAREKSDGRGNRPSRAAVAARWRRG